MRKTFVLWTLLIVVFLPIIGMACARATPTPATTPTPTPKPARPLTLVLHHAGTGTKATGNLAAFDQAVTNIKDRTGGDVIINFLVATLTQDYIENTEMLKSGAIDITDLTATAAAMPEIEVLHLPYLFRDYDHIKKVVLGPIGDEIVAKIEAKYPVKVLAWSDWGFRHFFNNVRPINGPEDLRGLKLRVPPSPTLVDAVNALGGSAISMSWGEFVSAMQQGVVDGGDTNSVWAAPLKIWEYPAKYWSFTYHSSAQSVVLMNRNSWNKLTKEEQGILVDEFSKARDRIWRENEAADAKVTKDLEAAGMKVNKPDLAPFQALAVKGVYPKYYVKHGKELIDSIVAVK